jgi:pyruvate,water dikinase
MANREALTLDLAQITKNHLGIAGGKAANLGELIQNDFPVPKGYVVTTAAYNSFLESNNLGHFIEGSLRKVDYSDYPSVEKCAKTIQEHISKCQLLGTGQIITINSDNGIITLKK